MELLADRLALLRRALALTDDELAKVVYTIPSVLKSRQVETRLAALAAELGLSESALPGQTDPAGPEPKLKKVVLDFPNVLMLSAENVAGTVELLQTELGCEAHIVRTILLRVPSLLGLSREENLAPTLAFLKGTVFDGDAVVLTRFLRKAPRVLSSSLEGNLRPKWKFICDLLGNDRPEPQTGMLLRHSLEQRLRPRGGLLFQKAQVRHRGRGVLCLRVVSHNPTPHPPGARRSSPGTRNRAAEHSVARGRAELPTCRGGSPRRG